MSEQEPSSEKYLTNLCTKCEEEFPLTPTNALVTFYLDIPECTFLFSQCTHCDQQEILFIAPDGNTAEQCADYGLPVEIEDVTPQNIMDMYRQYTGKEPIKLEVKTVALTPRQERLAEFVAYLLLHERLAAEDFQGEGDLYI